MLVPNDKFKIGPNLYFLLRRNIYICLFITHGTKIKVIITLVMLEFGNKNTSK